ncbi:MAG: dodecin [Streptosporangiaceae bacterium]|jgi:flavin-binding protein dodecin
MSDHVYRVTEIVGSSSDGIDQAIRSGLERAQHTLRNVDWFEVIQIRGALTDGQNPTVQVTMKIGFRLDEQ